MAKFIVDLRSRGHTMAHGLIKVAFIVDAVDDVSAAEKAKQKAMAKFPDRELSSWRADRVDMINEVMA
jgi:hypothetical protein